VTWCKWVNHKDKVLPPVTKHGFTLVEVLVALVVGLVVIGAVYSVYTVQQREYRSQQVRLALQQNLRAAMVIMEEEIRMAGYDPQGSGRFGIIDVRRYDTVLNEQNPEGQPALFYTVDVDENGVPDARNGNRNREWPNLRVSQDNDTGRRFLSWDNGGGRHPLAEDIVAMGLAFAVDADGDGRIDVWDDGRHLIWAVDSDNDNLLDTHLDANDDGIIDAHDDTDADGRITAADGGRIDPPLPLQCIRMVRLWLLAASAYPVRGHWDNRTYVVGDRVFGPAVDGRMRRLLETTIACRNL